MLEQVIIVRHCLGRKTHERNSHLKVLQDNSVVVE